MSTLTKQLEIESEYDINFVMQDVRAWLSDSEYAPIITECVKSVEEFCFGNQFKWEVRTQSFANLYYALIENEHTVEDIVMHMLTQTVSKKMSLQHLVSTSLKFTNNSGMPIKEVLSRMGEILQVISLSGLLKVHDPVKFAEDDSKYRRVESKLQLPDTLVASLNRTAFIPPMLIEPQLLDDKNTNGYYHYKHKLLKGKHNHGQKLNLNFLNIINGIPYSIDRDILEMEEAEDEDEKDASKLISFYTRAISTQDLANRLIKEGNRFYFVWSNDHRGRSYPKGYQLNIQGDDYRKALISFNKKEIVSDEILL